MAPFTPHSHSSRKWPHTERMNPHHQDNNLLHLRSKVSGVMRESECVCLKYLWGKSLINCQWWTVWVTHVFVWVILWYVRHVKLSVCEYVQMFCFWVCVYPLGQVETSVHSWSSVCAVWLGVRVEGGISFVCVIRPSAFPLKSCMTSFGMITQNNEGVRPLHSSSHW